MLFRSKRGQAKPGTTTYYPDYGYYAWPGGPEAQATKRGQAKPGTTTYYHDFGMQICPCSFNITVDTHTPVRIIRTRGVHRIIHVGPQGGAPRSKEIR